MRQLFCEHEVTCLRAQANIWKAGKSLSHNTLPSSLRGLPGGPVVKNPPANAGDACSIPGSGRSPGEGNGNLLQRSCLENSHGQRSLAGYSPWGCKESDMTEPACNAARLPSLNFHFQMYYYGRKRNFYSITFLL